MGHASRLSIPTGADSGGDAVIGDFVRTIAGGRLGVVESIENDHAVVLELGGVLRRSIIPCSLLRREVHP